MNTEVHMSFWIKIFNGLVGKESACNTEDTGDVSLSPGSGRSSGEGNGNPLQYSCLENPMERGTLWATGHEVAKSGTRLSDEHFQGYVQ